MDITEVRHIALGAAIDIWGDGDIHLHGLLQTASKLEDYLVNGFHDNAGQSQSQAQVAPVTQPDPKA